MDIKKSHVYYMHILEAWMIRLRQEATFWGRRIYLIISFAVNKPSEKGDGRYDILRASFREVIDGGRKETIEYWSWCCKLAVLLWCVRLSLRQSHTVDLRQSHTVDLRQSHTIDLRQSHTVDHNNKCKRHLTAKNLMQARLFSKDLVGRSWLLYCPLSSGINYT